MPALSHTTVFIGGYINTDARSELSNFRLSNFRLARHRKR